MPGPFAIFGNVVTTHSVEKAILSLAELWLPTYINVVASSLGLAVGSVQYPVAYQNSYDLDNYQEANTPTFVVVCETTVGSEFERGEAGEIGAWFQFEAAVLVADQTEASTRTIASLYASAVALMLEQHGGLGGLSDQTLTNKLVIHLPVKGNRSLALGQVNAETFVNTIMNKEAGPPRGTLPPAFGPYEDPTKAYPPWKQVEETSVEVDAETLTEPF